MILNNTTFSEQKITTTPLVNVEKIKPSFDEAEEENIYESSGENLKEKKKKKNKTFSSYINRFG